MARSRGDAGSVTRSVIGRRGARGSRRPGIPKRFRPSLAPACFGARPRWRLRRLGLCHGPPGDRPG
eukprot:7428514-Alexandrium_andersonii.AAC.1